MFPRRSIYSTIYLEVLYQLNKADRKAANKVYDGANTRLPMKWYTTPLQIHKLLISSYCGFLCFLYNRVEVTLTWSVEHNQNMFLFLQKSFECFPCKMVHLTRHLTPVFLWRRGWGWLLWTKAKGRSQMAKDHFLMMELENKAYISNSILTPS